MAVLGSSGCTRTPPGAMTKALIFDAQCSYQGGDRQAALICIQQALASSRTDLLDRASACELYDDAGLYHFATGDIEEARFCQSIAVLLSRSPQTPAVLQDFYLANLERIYRRLGLLPQMARIRAEVGILAREAAIRDEFYVRRYVSVASGG